MTHNSYRYALTSSWRTKSVSVVSLVVNFVKTLQKHLASVRKLSPEPQNDLPKALKSSPRDARTPLRASRTLPTAPESAPEGAQPSLFRPPKTSPALQKPMFSLRKTSISNFGALPTICERAATDCTPPGGAPVTQPGLFGPQPPSPQALQNSSTIQYPGTRSSFFPRPHTPRGVGGYEMG